MVWYTEGSMLFAHRSRTGYCIQDRLRKGVPPYGDGQPGSGAVRMHRLEEDRERLGKLLDRWAKPAYDPCEEWLSETYDSLQKAGKG